MHKARSVILLLLSFSLILPPGSVFGEEAVMKESLLSLSDCLNFSLDHNLDIKIAKIESRLKGQDVLIAESIFDAAIDGKISYTQDERSSSNTIAGTRILTNDYELGLTKMLPTGTEIEVDLSDQRHWTDSTFVTNNPTHTAELSFTVTQPVLKNFFGYVDQKIVKLSQVEAEQAGLTALNRIEQSVADVEKAYWQLVFAYQDVVLRKELLSRSKELYDIFAGHLKTGFAETTEIYETEANMRIRKADLAIARNNLMTASNNLKLLLNADGDFIIVPKEGLAIIEKKAILTRELNEAFISNRDYQIKKKEVLAKKINLKMKTNSLWPEIDLVGTFAVNGVDRKIQKAGGKLTTDKHPYYYAGVKFNVPIDNSLARGEYNKAMLEKEKAILELVQEEKNIITIIDEKTRDVNLHFENATRWTKIKKIQALKFSEEEKKLKRGRSSSKIVIDYQNDLTNAAISEYSAVLRFYFALIDLENEKDMLLARTGVISQ